MSDYKNAMIARATSLVEELAKILQEIKDPGAEQIQAARNTTPLERMEKAIIKALEEPARHAHRWPQHAFVFEQGKMTKTALRYALGATDTALISSAIRSLIARQIIGYRTDFRIPGSRTNHALEVLWILSEQERANPPAPVFRGQQSDDDDEYPWIRAVQNIKESMRQQDQE